MFFGKKKKEPGAPAPGLPRDPVKPAESDDALDPSQVEVLLKAIARVTESRDTESLLLDIVDQSIEVTGAERGFLILVDEAGKPAVRIGRQRGGATLQRDVRFSTTVVKRVLSEIEPVRATVSSESEALELGTSVYDLKLRAVMCVPLVSPDEEGREVKLERGVLYVDSKAATREFTSKDLRLFHALSQQIRIALRNARLNSISIAKALIDKQIEIATQVQRDLMPQLPNDVPGWDVNGWYKPAEGTTGDFYDFVKMKGGRLGIFIGDVTGHGLGPALIMAEAKAALRSYLKLLDDPGRILSDVNEDLGPRMDDGRFLTLFLAILWADGKVQAINAGQTPPLVWRAKTRTIEPIKGHGPALGMMDDFKYELGVTLQLELGDMLLMFTDGFVEARSKSAPEHLFDEEGMRKALSECADRGYDAGKTVEHVVRTAIEFSGGIREDDMTLVAARRTA